MGPDLVLFNPETLRLFLSIEVNNFRFVVDLPDFLPHNCRP
jgi:hypothetical protein